MDDIHPPLHTRDADVPRLPLKELISRKSRQRSCIYCMKYMRYLELPPSMKRWSPSHYGWRCEHCLIVWEIDGDINEGCSRWLKKKAAMRTRELFAALSAFGLKKKDPR